MEAHRRTLTPESIAPNGPDSNGDDYEGALRLLLPLTDSISFSRPSQVWTSSQTL